MTRRLFWTFFGCTSALVHAGRKQGLSGGGKAIAILREDLLPNEHFERDEMQLRPQVGDGIATSRNGFRGRTSQHERDVLGNERHRFLRRDCAPDDSAVTLVLVTDNYGWEMSWELSATDATGETVAKGPPEGANYARNSRYVGSWCVAPGSYVLTMRDEIGDGHCCKFGEGSVSIFIDGVLALQDSDDGDYDAKELAFAIEPKITESITREPSWSPFHPAEQTTTTPEPSIPPTAQPSRTPTEMPSFSPSKKPSSKPTQRPTSHPTGKPTFQPSRFPTTELTPSDAYVPSLSPSEGSFTSSAPTLKPSRKPTTKPLPYPTDVPSVESSFAPSFSPSHISEPFRKPTTKPTQSPTNEPTPNSTMMPSNSSSESATSKSPTFNPTRKPSPIPSQSPTRESTFTPMKTISISPTYTPNKEPTTDLSQSGIFPTFIPESTVMASVLPVLFSPSLFPSDVTYDKETSTSPGNATSGSSSKVTTTYDIPLRDFEFTLSYTDMKGNIDIDELGEKLSSHLLYYFRKNFHEDDHIVDVEVKVVELSDALIFQGSSKFRASVQAVFNETSVSSMEDLNDFIVDAFVGDGYDDFLNSLGNSSDSTIRSTTTFDFSLEKTKNPGLSSKEDFLSTDDNGTTSMGSIVLWIGLISIGVILAAIFVVSQRQTREAEIQEENDDNSTIITYGHDLLPCVVEVDTPPQKSFPQLDKSSGLDSESGPKWPGLLQTDPEENRGKKEMPSNMFPSSQQQVDCTNENDWSNFSSTLSSTPSSNSCFFSPSTHSSAPPSSDRSINKQEQISDRATRHEEIMKHDQSRNDFQRSSTGYELTDNDQSTSIADSNSRIDGEIINTTCISEERSASHIPSKSDQYILPHDGINTSYSSSVIVGSTESHNGDNIEIVARNRTTTADGKAKAPSPHRVERDKSQFLSKFVRRIIKCSTKDLNSFHANTSKSVSFSESALSHSRSARSRDCIKIGSSDQIAAENSSDSWTETSAHVSKRSSESEVPSIRGNLPSFFTLIQACTGTSHEGVDLEIQQDREFPGVEDGMLATEEDEESIFRTMIQSLTATSHEGQNLEVRPIASFPDFINDTTVSEFPDVDNDDGKNEGLTNIRDETSKISKTSTERSLISRVKNAVSKSTSNLNGDQNFIVSSVDVKNLKSRASKLLSPPKSKIVGTGKYESRGIRGPCSEKMDPKWVTASLEASSSGQEEENCDFRTMIQAHTATSHEGHDFEIQPKELFPDIVTDPINPDKTTSVQEELSNTTTVSTGKRTLFGKVKSIVSKPPLKFDQDDLDFSPNNSKQTMEGQSKEKELFSHSDSKDAVIHQFDSRDIYDSYDVNIDPKWGTSNKEATSWEQEEGQSLFHTMIQALTATSHEGQNFEIQQKAGFSDVKTGTPDSADVTPIQENVSSTTAASTRRRALSSKVSTAVSKTTSKFAGDSLAFSPPINDMTQEVESQSISKIDRFAECDCRESCDSCSEKSDSNRGTTNTVASLLKLQEEGNVFHTVMHAITATSHEGRNFENQLSDKFTDMKKSAPNSVEAMSNQEELSKRSHSRKFSYSSKNDNSREIVSNASIPQSSKCSCFSKYDCRDSYDSYSEKLDSIWGTSNSVGSSWGQEKEGNNAFHTMIQTLTATSHEGQNIEIQPNNDFLDKNLDDFSLEKANSIQEQYSKTSTVSNGKRSFLRKVKSIVSKPLPKYAGDSLAFTQSTEIKVAGGLESEVCTSPSQSHSRNVSASENKNQDQQGSWDTSSYRIDPNWEVDSSHASTWNELEQTSIQCSLGPECLSTISGESSEEDNDSGTTISEESSEEDNDSGTTRSADSTVSSISTAT